MQTLSQKLITKHQYAMACLQHAAADRQVEQKAGDGGFYCLGFN